MVNGKKIALILTLFVVCPHILLAANHFIRAGAAGTGSGADWANAYPHFSGACAPGFPVRGDTYYVAGETYTAPKFSVPESGTAVIIIKGATAADHGTSTGWLATYGVDVSQATFKFSSYGSYPGNAAIYISSSYWVFDGNTGTDGVPSSYGFRSAPLSAPCGSDMAGVFYGDGGNVSNVTVRWFAFDASGCSDTDFVGRQGTNEATSGNFNNNTISHFYCNKAQDCVTLHWSNGQVAAT